LVLAVLVAQQDATTAPQDQRQAARQSAQLVAVAVVPTLLMVCLAVPVVAQAGREHRVGLPLRAKEVRAAIHPANLRVAAAAVNPLSEPILFRITVVPVVLVLNGLPQAETITPVAAVVVATPMFRPVELVGVELVEVAVAQAALCRLMARQIQVVVVVVQAHEPA